MITGNSSAASASARIPNRTEKGVHLAFHPVYRWSQWIPLAIAIIALISLVGWIANISHFVELPLGLVPMKFNSALAFLFASCAIVFSQKAFSISDIERQRQYFVVARLLALPVGLLGLLTLVEYLTTLQLGIDEVLFTYPSDLIHGKRMSFVNGVNFTLTAGVLCFINVKGRDTFRIVQIMMTPILVSAFLGIMGFLYGNDSLYSIAPYYPMAPQSSALFFLMGVSLAMLRPDRGAIALLLEPHPIGRLTRRLSIAAIIIPLALGYFLLKGSIEGWYDVEFGAAAFSSLTVLFLLLIIWWSSHSLTKAEHLRVAAEKALQHHRDSLEVEVAERTQSLTELNRLLHREISERQEMSETIRKNEEQLRVLFDNAPHGIIEIDDEERILAGNARFFEMLGYQPDELQGKTIHDIIVPDDRPKSLTLNRQLRHGEMDRFAYEKRYLQKGGSSLWVRVNVSAIRDQHDRHHRSVAIVEDITERKRAEEALRKSEARLQKAISTQTVGVLFFNLDGRMVDANDAFVRMSGYSREELLGMTHWEFLTPAEFNEVTNRAFQGLLNHGETAPYEKQIVRKDGSRRWGLFAPTRLSGSGIDSNCVEFIIDITESKVMEEALRESEERHRRLFDTMLMGVVYQNADGTVLTMNPAAERILGKSMMEFLGETSESVDHDSVREDGSPFPGSEHPSMVALRTGKEVHDVVMGVYNPKERRYRWISVNAIPLFNDGEKKPFQVYTIFDDITKQKEAEAVLRTSEERFRQLADSMPQLVWTSNSDGRVDYYNERVKEFEGFVHRESGTWQWEPVLHPDDIDKTIRAWNHSLATGKTYQVEHRVQRKDQNDYRWFLSRAVPVFDEHGKILKWFGTATDIHDLREAQEALRQSEGQLANIIASAMDGVITINEEQEIVLFNAAAERMFGIAATEAIGQKLNRFIPERYQSAHREHVRSFGKTHTTRRTMGHLGAVFGVRTNGEEFPVEASISQVTTGGKKLYTVILRDITDRLQREEEIRSSLREKETLLKEIHHRVKNNMQVISSMLRIQSQQTHDAKLTALLIESQNRIRSMALVHEQLYQTRDLSRIPLQPYISSLVMNLFRSYGVTKEGIRLALKIPNISLGIDTAIPCGLIVNELVSNSLKYAFPDGREGELRIEVEERAPDIYVLTVADDGVGLPEGFDLRQSQSLGLQLVESFIDELRGELRISSNGRTEFQVIFHELHYKERMQ